MSEAGLITRGVLGWRGLDVIVQELWNVQTPGCPVVVFDMTTRTKNPNALWVRRTFKMSEAEAQKCGLLI